MHTRRFGAFIIGMWLMGAVLVWFATSQAYVNVDRVFSNPPQQMQKELNDMGPDTSRQLFRYQAAQYARRVQETWDVIQLGVLGALLATSVLTMHRSRVIVIATAVMMLLVAIQAFRLTPVMNVLARAYDFLPPTAALRERESFNTAQTWHRVLEVIKLGLALAIAGRLMFDFYDFGSLISPGQKTGKRRRRPRRTTQPTPQAADTSGAEVETEASLDPEDEKAGTAADVDRNFSGPASARQA